MCSDARVAAVFTSAFQEWQNMQPQLLDTRITSSKAGGIHVELEFSAVAATVFSPDQSYDVFGVVALASSNLNLFVLPSQ